MLKIYFENSIIINGDCDPLIDVDPLSLIWGAVEGLPEAWTILTPDTFPLKALAGSPAGTSWRDLDEILPIEKPSFLAGVPIATPVIIISSSKLSGSRLTLISVCDPTKTDLVP